MRFINVSTANPFSVLFTQMTFQSIPLVVSERKPFQSPGSVEQQQKTIDCRWRDWSEVFGMNARPPIWPVWKWKEHLKWADMSWAGFIPKIKSLLSPLKRIRPVNGSLVFKSHGLDLPLYCSTHFEPRVIVVCDFFFILSHVLLKGDFYPISSFKNHLQVRSTVSLHSRQRRGLLWLASFLFPKQNPAPI